MMRTVQVIVRVNVLECANCCMSNINLEVSCVLVSGFIRVDSVVVLLKVH